MSLRNFFSSCAVVSVFWFLAGNRFWCYLLRYVSRVQYSCGVVLIFWFWREIGFNVTYVLSVQYSCAVVSVFWLWHEIVLKMRTPLISYEQFLQKNLIGLLYYAPLANVCILLDLTLLYSVSFYSISFSCIAQIHKL